MKHLLYAIFILFLSCQTKNNTPIEQIVEVLKSNDVKLNSAKPGEWLYKRKEKGQTFKEYKSCKPKSPTETRRIIYLQPIGKFTSVQSDLINYTADYLHIFYGLKTVVLNAINENSIPENAKRIGIDGNQQLLASYIQNKILKHIKPNDAIVCMAITVKDLYPGNSWNYVFGLASYNDNIGETSLYRFADYDLNASNYSLCLSRLIKISSHEIGHMFSIKHCINAHCTMNGTNNLFETDNMPNRLCSQCTGKILWNLKLNNLIRLQKLKEYFQKHNLQDDQEKIESDIKLFS